MPCHGPQGKGDGPVAAKLDKEPRNLTSPLYREQSDGTLYWKISNGHHPMPQFSDTLPEESRWNLVNYVRTFGNHAGTTP